jgi:hypothetical protein
VTTPASTGSWHARRRIFGSRRSNPGEMILVSNFFENTVELVLRLGTTNRTYNGFGDSLSNGIDLRSVTTTGNADADVDVC